MKCNLVLTVALQQHYSLYMLQIYSYYLLNCYLIWIINSMKMENITLYILCVQWRQKPNQQLILKQW